MVVNLVRAEHLRGQRGLVGSVWRALTFYRHAVMIGIPSAAFAHGTVVGKPVAGVQHYAALGRGDGQTAAAPRVVKLCGGKQPTVAAPSIDHEKMVVTLACPEVIWKRRRNAPLTVLETY